MTEQESSQHPTGASSRFSLDAGLLEMKPGARKLRQWFSAVILVWLIFGCRLTAKAVELREIVHEFEVSPIRTGDEVRRQAVVQRVDGDGRPVDYRTTVESVDCYDGKCQVVSVRLFWNDIGEYDHFELGPEVELEKAEGIAFTEADYKRLDEILADRASILKEVRYEEIENYRGGGSEVDAVSGATPPVFQGAVVQGAALTCYTLWHWANGELSAAISRITAETSTTDDLIRFLRDGDEDHQMFALRVLKDRDVYSDGRVVDAVVEAAARGGRNVAKPAIAWLRRAPGDVYRAGLEEVFQHGGELQRRLVLEALRASARDLPDSYVEAIGRRVVETDSYPLIDSYLRLLEARKAVSAAEAATLARLLDRDDVLISRRVYWFLKYHPTSESVANLLEAYRERHRGIGLDDGE